MFVDDESKALVLKYFYEDFLPIMDVKKEEMFNRPLNSLW